MAYSIGQFRQPQLKSFYDNYSLDNISTLTNDYNIAISGTNFTNKYIHIDQKLAIGTCYYLKITVNLKEIPPSSGSHSVRIYLSAAGNESSSSKQQIGSSFYVNSNIMVHSISFIPEQEYDYILFSIDRATQDYKNINSVNTHGCLFDTFEINNFYSIPNTIDILKQLDSNSYSQIENIKKLGVQAKNDFQFNIDGENIKIGNSGIYQLNNGYLIKQIYFYPDSEYFIMDFEF